MFKNYIKIAWRNLIKNKQQTIINLLGLTVGTVSCLTILLYVFDQTGYDRHHDHAESIYRVRTINKNAETNGADFVTAAAGPPIAFAMKNDFPEIVEACRIVLMDEFNVNLVQASDHENGYYEPRAYLADSTVFKVFTYKFIEGSSKSALNAPNTIVLSSSLANKLFGQNKALNKTIELGSGEDALLVTVTGVFDDAYGKSHLKPNYYLSMNTPGLGEYVRNGDNFRNNNFVYTYVSLVPNTNAAVLESKLPAFLKSHGGEEVADKTLYLQEATDIHLYSKGIKFQIDTVSNIEYLYFLLILAFFIQLVACINFINLSTARANKRAKEIGVRKVVGANKGALMGQFLGESFVVSLYAILISIPLAILLLPFVNELTQSSLSYTSIFSWKILSILLGLGIFTGLVAGIYPALVLSSIKPIQALKSTINIKSGNGNFRKTLVVFQFAISITLITSVIIITQQFRYTQKKDLGFKKENLLAVRFGTDETKKSYSALKSRFLEISGISQVAGVKYSPAERVLNDFGVYRPGGSPDDNITVHNNAVSEDYFNAIGANLLQGRELREGDENQIVVNEALLKALNIKLDLALGSKLLNTYEDETQEFEIVGIVGDYHFASLKDVIEPLLLYKSKNLNWMILRTETTNYKQLLHELEQRWKSTVSNVPFTYVFMDKEMGEMYVEERRLGNISTVFTFLAIFISCLGLFGLVSYVAEQKKKEIGIRKVLGASIKSVVKLLTTDFVKLVGIAFLIASPIAYFFMQRWLEDFTYRIDIQWWVFVLAGGFALMITLLTVGFQSIKSAMANPVKSLRSE